MIVKRIDFYFDFISPYSYLASTQVPELVDKYNVEVRWLPVNLPRLIKLSGNQSPAVVKNKAIYSLRDLKRWATYLGVPFKMIRPGSFDSRPALRIAGALKEDQQQRFCMDIFDALWSGSVDPTERGWVQQVARVKGIPETWIVKQNEAFELNTKSALNAGAFGAPSFVLHREGARNELFFGVDHLDFLVRAIDNN